MPGRQNLPGFGTTYKPSSLRSPGIHHLISSEFYYETFHLSSRSRTGCADDCHVRVCFYSAVEHSVHDSRAFSNNSRFRSIAPADISTGIRHDVDLRGAAARLLAQDLRICARSEMARSRSTLDDSTSQLLVIFRFVERSGVDQSSLRARLHRRGFAERQQLHRDRFCCRDT